MLATYLEMARLRIPAGWPVSEHAGRTPVGRTRTPEKTNAQVNDLGVRDPVELRGIEPLTYSMRTSRATNCATAPCSSAA